LPGSNLTNLIVVDHLHQSGGAFAARMFPAWVAAVVVVTAVVALAFRRRLRRRPTTPALPPARRSGTGAVVFLLVAVVAVLVLPPPWAAVITLGAGVTGLLADRHATTRRPSGVAPLGWPDVHRAVDLPVLVGLFGLAVAAGGLGRSWDSVTTYLAHLSGWETAGVGAGLSVLVNNLPAASFLAARSPGHPYDLLVGLDLGPNLAVTGALSAVLWFQVARRVGARPSALRYSLLGIVVAPVSMAAALAVLGATR
jgi:arsenical pump membrane protein